MKKLLSILIFAVLAAALSATAFAAGSDVIASGYCGGEGDGTNLTWTLTEDGTLTISGEGRMASYDEEDAPWEVYLDKFDKLVIKEGVTIIGSEAFFWCQNLTGNIVIPDSVIDIYSYAFNACNFDGKLTIGKNVKYIGDCAFNSCFYLTGDLIIPKSVETIGELAFCDCQHLTGDLIIPDSVKSLGYKAFWRCKGFNGDLIIGDNVKTIGFETFAACSGFTGKLILGNKVETIEQSAFAGCSGFTGKLIIPKSVKTIEYLAFQSCGIDEYYFAGNAPTVESYSFDSDDTIYYPSGNSTWIIEDGKWNGYTAVLYEPYIASGYCGGEGDGTNLTWTLTEDGTLTISGEGEMKNYSSSNSKTTAPWGEYSDSLKTLVIEKGVTGIGKYAFYNCSSFTGSLTIPDSVTTIGECAFLLCSGFTDDLVIGDSVTTIGNFAFNGCSGFTGNLVIGDSVTIIGDVAFYNCSGFTGSLTIPDSVTTIGNSAFRECTGFTGSLVIGNSVTTIGDEAFRECTGFTGDLVIGNSVTTIGNFAFYGCSGFTGDLIIGNGVMTIGNGAFNNCSGFTGDIMIPESVTIIESYAFYYCGAQEYFFRGNAPSIGSSAFDSDDTIYYHSNNSTWKIVNGKWNGYTAVPYSNEPDATLSIFSEKLVSGGQTTVSVNLSEGSGVAAAQFAIKYDTSKLELVSASAGELMSGAVINTEIPGKVIFGWENPTAVTEGGTILELTFTTAEGAQLGETKIEIDENEKFIFTKSNLDELSIDVENGAITVIDAVYGDLSGDGEIDIRDAYIARLIAAKLETPDEIQKYAGDVDGDGKITAVDANYIRKYSVRLISVFPVEQQ